MIFGLAHVRGGLINGGNWYADGRVMTKQNTFTDFIVASEFLIKNNWTTSQQLAAEGASAGGLLIGTVVNQRPDLYQVRSYSEHI